MKKKEEVVEVLVSGKSGEYFRLVRADRNLFQVETVTVVDGVITKTEADEAAYLPIAFDKLRRKTANAFFDAVREENAA